MADKNSRLSVKKKEKKVDIKTDDEKEKAKGKEKVVKKPDKVVKKPECGPEKPKEEQKTGKKPECGPEKPKEEQKTGKDGEKTEGAEGMETEENGAYQPIELPPFEIITGEKMSLFYFKFQFRNVEYSSGRNKTLLCFRVDTPGGAGEGESLSGYMEDEHSTAHVEEAFFKLIIPNSSQEYEVTWYVSSSPCAACAAKLAAILQERKKLRLCIFCSRLFDWEEPEIIDGLRALVRAGCKLRMMTPFDFLHVWNRYVENEDQEFTPWEDCKDNYEYYLEKLSDILK